MIIALFEDEYYANFLPITYTRPVSMLRSGIFTALERAKKAFPDCRPFLFFRDYLGATFRRRFIHPINALGKIDEEILLVNSALVLDAQAVQVVKAKVKENVAIVRNGRLAVAKLNEKVAKQDGQAFLKPMGKLGLNRFLKKCEILRAGNLSLMNYTWNLIDNCSRLIVSDYAVNHEAERMGTIDEHAVVYGEKSRLFVGEGSTVEAFVTLDVRNGPIYIGRNVVVESGSKVSGPAYIGDNTIIASAIISGGCSIGDVCRIGGELEETIVQGYANKHHLGYLGNSYVGEWVNIGAGTNNSNLKNTYGSVRVNVAGKQVDTEKTKVGCFIGDHAKTSIGTQIYTGRKIGIASHVHGFITEDVPSFTLWAETMGGKPAEIYLESAIETEKRVFARRNIKQSKDDVELLKKLFTLTGRERKRVGVVRKKFELQ